MFEGSIFVILLFLSLFGGLIVPVLMGVSLWIERREHRIRMAGVSPAGLSPMALEVLRRRATENRERISRFAPRQLQRSDLVGVWPIAAFAFVLLMPPATWAGSILDDFLFAVHPIICVGWWLNMRSRGIIRAEVYALSIWVTAYVAWSLSMLAPFELWNRGLDGLDGDFPSFLAERLGTTSDLALILWLLYVASGIACVLAGTLLARAERPIVSPLATVAVSIPFVWGVLNTNPWLTVLGLVMAVGVAGYGISREVRRSQDDADIRAGAAVRETRSTLPWKTSNGLILRTAIVVIVSVAIWIAVRETASSNPAAEIAATWVALVLTPLVTALLARLDNLPRVVSAWAAWAWLATVSALAAYRLFGATRSMFLELIPWVEPALPGESLDSIIHPQAIAVWLVAVVSFAVAYRAGKLRSYGALLLGLLWFPIATFAASLRWSENEFDPFPDPVGYASMVVMGCVLLVIMWRFFGPGETPSINAQPSAVAAADDPDGPESQANAVHPLPVSQLDGKQTEAGPIPKPKATSSPES